MGAAYPESMRREARIMWLSGNYGTDSEIAKILDVTPQCISNWKREDEWEEEKVLLDRETKRKVDDVLGENVASIKRRHILEYQAMQQKGLVALKNAEARTISDVVSLIDVGVKGERTVRGMTAPDFGGIDADELLNADTILAAFEIHRERITGIAVMRAGNGDRPSNGSESGNGSTATAT